MDTTLDRAATATAAPTMASPQAAVICMTLMSFTLISSEFMPIALLTPIAQELSITEGQAGQAIAISGFFAIITSLFSNTLFSKIDRRTVVLLYTAAMVLSGLIVTFAPNAKTFMFGRALIGISIGGFFSIATAIFATIATGAQLVKALAWLQAGSALAAVIAQPLGSFLGGWIGWRGAFFVVVPIGLLALVWQLLVLPRLPPKASVSVGQTFALMRNRTFAIGMAAMTLFFMGQFSLSTYLRPYLEGVTNLDVNTLSLVLLSIGLAGLAGTTLIGRLLMTHLGAVLIVYPAALVLVVLLLIGFGPVAGVVAGLLALWGFLTTPIPVAWNTWMTRVIPNQLEAGGGLLVALIQLGITAGAFVGGFLFDHAGWWGPLALSALMMLGSALFAVAAGKK